MRKLMTIVLFCFAVFASSQVSNYESEILPLLKNDKYDESLPLLENYIKTERPDPNAYLWLGGIYLNMGKKDTSLYYLSKTISCYDLLIKNLTIEDIDNGKWKNYSGFEKFEDLNQFGLESMLEYFKLINCIGYAVITNKIFNDLAKGKADSVNIFLNTYSKDFNNYYYRVKNQATLFKYSIGYFSEITDLLTDEIMNADNVDLYLNNKMVQFCINFATGAVSDIDDPALQREYHQKCYKAAQTIKRYLLKEDGLSTIDDVQKRNNQINLFLSITNYKPKESNKLYADYEYDGLIETKVSLNERIELLTFLKGYSELKKSSNVDSLLNYKEQLSVMLLKRGIFRTKIKQYNDCVEQIQRILYPKIQESLLNDSLKVSIADINYGTTDLTKYSQTIKSWDLDKRKDIDADYLNKGFYSTEGDYLSFSSLLDSTGFSTYGDAYILNYYDGLSSSSFSIAKRCDSELKKSMFVETNEFKVMKYNFFVDVENAYKKIYRINGVDYAHMNKGEMEIPNYNVSKGGFDILLSKIESSATMTSTNDYFDSGVVNRVKLNKVPLEIINAIDFSSGTNSLFIPVKTEDALEIENNKGDLGLMFYFRMGGIPIKQSCQTELAKVWHTENVRVVAYSKSTGKIYYTCLYKKNITPAITKYLTCDELVEEYKVFVNNYIVLANKYKSNPTNSAIKIKYAGAKMELSLWKDKIRDCKNNPKYNQIILNLFSSAINASVDIK